MIFPDKATLYIAAIEDAEYKESKIECEYAAVLFSTRSPIQGVPVIHH